jgi:hypothetical protein
VLCGSALVLARLLAPSGPVLDSHIPNEQWLINEGLSGTPGPSQAGPMIVDRVLVDGAATYVQFHLTGAAGQIRYAPLPLLLPTLYDDRRTRVNEGTMGSIDRADGALPLPGGPLPLPGWVPWHPPVDQRGYAIFGPLRAGARAAILRFASGETVTVPLHLGALAARKVTHPGTRVRASGLTLTVRAVDEASITYTYTFRGAGGGGGTAVHPQLFTAHGRTLAVTNVVSFCRRASGRAGMMTCRDTWVFAPQPRGRRLMLTIGAFELNAQPGRFSTVHGPWHLSVVAP